MNSVRFVFPCFFLISLVVVFFLQRLYLNIMYYFHF